MVADNGNSGAYPIRSVDRVCNILDTLANAGSGVTLTEVADATALPKSSAFRYLAALEARHYVEIERDADAITYRLGPAFRPQHTMDIGRLTEFARPALEQLQSKLGETINLGVLDGTAVVHTIVCESHHMMRLAARVGDHGFVHATALGKAMCALLPEDRVRSIVEATGMPSFTAATITDIDVLLAELARIRVQGWAVDDAENQDDGRCVAVAIVGLAFPAGISMSAPASRFPADQVPAVAKMLRKVGRDLTRQMKG